MIDYGIMPFDFTSGPIELKLTSYPYKDILIDMWFIQCKSDDSRLSRLIGLCHPYDEPNVYVIYLNSVEYMFGVERINKRNLFVNIGQYKDMNEQLHKVFNSGNEFKIVVDYKEWIDKWNDNYGDVYKLII